MRHFNLAVGLVLGTFLAACSAAPNSCDVNGMAYGDSQVVTHTTDDGKRIELVRYQAANGCTPQVIDSYEEEGGNPTLEAVFTHTVKGEENVFTIVSWPMNHAGANLRGTVYSVYAYHPNGQTLVRNDAVVKNRYIYGGIVGTVEGEELTFEGTTPAGVISLLKQYELE